MSEKKGKKRAAKPPDKVALFSRLATTTTTTEAFSRQREWFFTRKKAQTICCQPFCLPACPPARPFDFSMAGLLGILARVRIARGRKGKKERLWERLFSALASTVGFFNPRSSRPFLFLSGWLIRFGTEVGHFFRRIGRQKNGHFFFQPLS